MGRPTKAIPSYRYHVSGNAVVTFESKDFYLGPYNSPPSRAKYFALLQEYNSNGFKAPKGEVNRVDQPITVRCITAKFREHIETKYANSPQHLSNFRNLCTLLEDEHGDESVEQFGPRKLSRLRELFVANGNCRSYVNSQTRNVVSIFKHGVSMELVRPEQLVALRSLETLRAGQTTAPESVPVQPVDIEVVRLTAKFLSPTLRSMVRLQTSTGMRPSEVFRMRPCDIDRSSEIWMYRPSIHKTANLGRKKAVPIVGDAKDALLPYLLRDEHAYCFSPKESAKWYRDQRTKRRKTKSGYGNAVGTNRKANPKRPPREQYCKDSYRSAIQAAQKKAKVPRWFPYQLRHLAGTIVRDALGVEYAQSLLGHSHVSITEIYAKVSEAKSIEAAKVTPKIG